ncbi:hypothetical protein [Streptomyces luteireticuli]
MAGQSAADKMRVEVEALKGFKNRVDEALTELGGSEAAHANLAAEKIDKGHFGQDFVAAGALYGMYNAVHEDLANLSKLLSDQIEALSLAVQGAHNDYQGTDLDHRDKMWAVQRELAKYYDPKQDPNAKSAGRDQVNPAPEKSGGTHGEGEM